MELRLPLGIFLAEFQNWGWGCQALLFTVKNTKGAKGAVVVKWFPPRIALIGKAFKIARPMQLTELRYNRGTGDRLWQFIVLAGGGEGFARLDFAVH